MRKSLILLALVLIAQKFTGQTSGTDTAICFTKAENDTNIKIVEKLIEDSQRKDSINNALEQIKSNKDTVINSLILSNQNLSKTNLTLLDKINTLENNITYKDRISDRRSIREVILGAVSAILITIELNRVIK